MARIFAFVVPSLAIAIALAGCSDGEKNSLEGWTGQGRIPVVGGEPAQPSEYPATVALIEFGSPACTGTLIHPKVVLTAAHCLQWAYPQFMKVVYGVANANSAPSSAQYAVASVTPHPQYNGNAQGDVDGLAHANDIGIVVLQNEIPNAVIAPIFPADQVDAALPDWTETSSVLVDIVGYGIYNMQTDASGLLYKARTPHVRHIQWELLAGKPNLPDTCNGDSGGPLYLVQGCDIYLVGVTSRMWKQATHTCGDGGIYTMAPAYRSWIEQQANVTLVDPALGGMHSTVCYDAGTPDAQPDGAGGSAGGAGAAGSGGDAGAAGTGGTGGGAGSAGEAGSAGTAGAAGEAGAAGQGGDAGSAGSAGTAGEAGSAGTAGEAGSAGTAGAGTGGTAGAGTGGSAGAGGKAGSGQDAGKGGSSPKDASADAEDPQPPAEESAEGGGCGCRTTPSTSNVGWFGLLAAACLTAWRRRRNG